MASPKVTAAAQATASWARARRAAWAAAPLARPEAAPPVVFPAPDPPSTPRPASPPLPAAIVDPPSLLPPTAAELSSAPPDILDAFGAYEPFTPAIEAEPEPEPPPAATPKLPREPLVSRAALIRGASAAAILAGVAAGVYFLSTSGAIGAVRRRFAAMTTSTPAPPPASAAASAPKSVGSLRVSSTPTGARVLIDGREAGATPLSLDNLPLGSHLVALESSQGSVQRTVVITADRPATVEESIFAGWVAVFAPFELTVADGTRPLRPDDRNEIMLSAGVHALRFSNRALGFEELRQVEVKPGERQRVTIVPPRSTISVTASEPAEVWVDGVRLGSAPVSGVPMALGSHDLVVKRASGGDRRRTITVTVKPFVANIEF